jgi:anti-sigma factor RsiW
MWPFRSKKSKMMMKKGLMCQQLVELLTDYLDGVLPDAEHREVEAHLAMCEHCTAYMDQFRQTIAATGSLTIDDISEPAMNDLLDVFRNWKATEPQG